MNLTTPARTTLLLLAACAHDGEELASSELAVVAQLDTTTSPHGQISTLASAGAIDFTDLNAFFASLGVNGRTCGSCHHEDAAWSITPAIAGAVRVDDPADPLFDPIDGTDCPLATNPNPSTHSKELLKRGNFRVEIGIPPGADFTLAAAVGGYGCATPPSASRLYLYRRPLPTANLAFLTTVMWDGRASVHDTVRDDLLKQADDATRGHARATGSLSALQAAAIVDFEMPLFSAATQVKHGNATVDLTAGATGGPAHLCSTVAPAFFVGINDTFSPTFDPRAFTLFRDWEPTAPQAGLTSLQRSIGRGEALFNTRTFAITGVAGLNGPDDPSQAAIVGTCTTCHNSPDVGNHSSPLAIDIGVASADGKSPAGKTLDIKGLPAYTFVQTGTGRAVTVTDPGRALITGRFVDIGKMKGPILRGLAAREPLFHNGSATIDQAVRFYDLRFAIGLTPQQRADLANFLKAL